MNASAPPPLRPPHTVMRLSRMGSFHQTRLSFMRALLRDLKRDRWQFARADWQVDARGCGYATYRAIAPQRTYTLICFAHDLPPALRSDRVIADQWDATFALYDGVPDAAEIARMQDNVPKQEAGNCQQSELVLARANRSVRLFAHVVDQLARGEQPHRELLERSGYLMRTTAVYGNGKFGLSDRDRIKSRAEFAPPFRAELLAVWLIRWFTIDIAEHLARVRDPQRAVKLDRNLARRLGVGNATGLGMAPFVMQHPVLIHRWMHARETALARVRATVTVSPQTQKQFGVLLARMKIALTNWCTDDHRQSLRIAELKTDLATVTQHVNDGALQQPAAWDALTNWAAQNLSAEGQELLVSLVLEPHGETIDDLTEEMTVDESQHFHIDGAQTVGALRESVAKDYEWALHTDYTAREQCARFWYVSEEKLEPRLGERFDEPGVSMELPLAFARDVAALHEALTKADAQMSLADFLLQHPQHRHAARRAQIAARFPYCEIRDNLISAELLPLDLLRCKLSFFGANQFDPKSDRWVRITMYQHAPLPDELATMDADDWSYPPLD